MCVFSCHIISSFHNHVYVCHCTSVCTISLSVCVNLSLKYTNYFLSTMAKTQASICCWKVIWSLWKTNICLFDLILYIPVNNFSVMLGRVFLGWSSTRQGLMCLAQGHNAVPRLELASPRSRVKHSTTEPLRSQKTYINRFKTEDML